MKKITQRFLSILLTLAMVISMLPAFSVNADAYGGDWVIGDGSGVVNTIAGVTYDDALVYSFSIYYPDANDYSAVSGLPSGYSITKLASNAYLTGVSNAVGSYTVMVSASYSYNDGDLFGEGTSNSPEFTLNVLGKVTYDANEGTGTVTDSQAYAKDATVTVLSGSTLTRDGYTFVGWNTKQDGTGISYDAGDEFSMGTSNVTLYAVWKEKHIARIGDTEYATVQAAVDAAGATPTTIVMLNDSTEKITISSGTDITLDLNGHTLSKPNETVLTVEGTFTVQDSATGGCITGFNGIKVKTGGTANISAGTITGSTTDQYGVYVNGGNVNISGAVSISTPEPIVVDNNGILHITGGSSASNNNGNAVDVSSGTATITDGEFNGDVYSSSGAELVITGGKFSENPGEYVASGYAVKQIQEAPYFYEVVASVCKITACASNTDLENREYATIGLAIDEAGSNAVTIQLIDDDEENVTIPTGADITLDLNGYVLKGTGDNSVIINNCTLTVQDSKTEAKHYFKYSSQGAWTLDTEECSGIAISAITDETANDTVIEVQGGCITGGTGTTPGLGAAYGGGIFNNGTLTVAGGNIIGNSAYFGGGIHNNKDCALVVTGGIVTGNDATIQGGGVYVYNNTITPSSGNCFTAGTQITMGDGSTKNIEEIAVGDYVKSFNHETGEYESSRVMLAYTEETESGYFTLHFASGASLSICDCHDLFERSANRYVTVSENNYSDYIGQDFYNALTGTWDKLQSVTLSEDTKRYYSLYIARTSDCIAEGFLSVPDDICVLDIYTFNADLTANQAALEADIAQYGIYEFSDCRYISSYEEYEEFNAKYINIVIGKGLATAEELNAAYLEWYAEEEPTVPIVKLVQSAAPLMTKSVLLNSVQTAPLTVGGTAKITGNIGGGAVSNVFLASGTNLAVGTPAAGMNVGVTLENAPGAFTTNGAADEVKYFTSDKADYAVRFIETTRDEPPIAAHLELARAYTVTYDANTTSTVTNLPEDNSVYTEGESVTLSTTKPVCVGYKFLGWNTSDTATDAETFANGKYTMNASNVTFYAVWEETYTVTYNANAGEDTVTNMPSDTTEYVECETVTVDTATIPVRDGYRFVGWNRSSTATTAENQFDISEDTVLYAVWAEIGHYTYNSGWDVAPETSYNAGDPIKITSNSTLSGFIIVNGKQFYHPRMPGSWTKEYEIKNNGATLVLEDCGTYGRAVLTDGYRVIYDDNVADEEIAVPTDDNYYGEPFEYNSVTYIVGKTATISSIVPTRDGYQFLGWNTQQDGKGTSYAAGAEYTVGNSDATIYAVWKEIRIARIGDTVYRSIKAAIDAAGATPTTIVMLDDSTENVTIGNNQNITLNLDGHTLTGTGSGSVIQVKGELTLTDTSIGKTGKVTGGKGYGGGVYVDSSGVFTLDGGAISGNTAPSGNGGGVYVSNGVFTMNGGTISDNTASNMGGGVCVDGSSASFVMNGGTISGNTAPSGNGGGVCVSGSGSVTMNGGTISGNTANQCGGLYTAGGSMNTVSLLGGTITGNTDTDEDYHFAGVLLNCSNEKTYTVGGNIRIYGNTSTNGAANLVLWYFTSGQLAIDSEKPLAEGTEIHISLYNTSGTLISGAVTMATDTDYSSYFASDSASYKAYNSGTGDNQQVILSAHEHTWTYAVDSENSAVLKAWCSETFGKDANCTSYNGETNADILKIVKPLHTSYGDGKDAAATLTDASGAAKSTLCGLTTLPAIQYQKKIGEDTYGEATQAAPTDAGTYRASLTIGSGTDAKTAFVEYTIAPKSITVTTESASKVYDGTALTAPVGTVTDLVSGETVTLMVTGSLTNVGTGTNLYTINWNGTAKESNYEVRTENLGTLTVTPKAVIVTATDLSKVYGEDDPELTATVSGTIGSDTVTYTVSRAAGENAGTYAITPTGEASQGNYAVTFAPGIFTITKAKVTVPTANTGLVYNGQEQTGVATETDAKYTLTDNTATNAGEYTATAVLFDKTNYEWNLASPTELDQTISWSIATATNLTVTGTGYTGVYDGKAHGNSATPSDLSGTTVSYSVDGGATYTKDVPTLTNAGTVTVLVKAENPNYVTATVSYTLTVMKKSITVTTESAEKVHDGTVLTAAVGTVSDLVAGETVTITAIGSQTDIGTSTNLYTITWDGTAKESNYKIGTENLGILTVKGFTVTFDSMGGSKVTSVTGLALNDTVQKPQNPNRLDSTFNGWYLDGQAYDFGAKITKDITLEAHWILDETANTAEKETTISDDGTTTTKIQVIGTTNEVKASGLESIAKAEKAKATDSNIKIVLTVKETTETAAPQAEVQAIKEEAGEKTVDLLTIDLIKYSNVPGANTENEKITETGNQVIEIFVPFDTKDKTNLAVYRYHGTKTDIFTKLEKETAGADATYYTEPVAGSETKIIIHLFTTKFSTYAVGYTVAETNTDTDTYYYTPVTKKTCPQDETCVYAKFTDANTKSWYHDGVHFCVEKGYMNGITETEFSPNGTLSRGMIVAMLWRMEGEPVVNYAMSFLDVNPDFYYAEAIRWAESVGIVTGYNESYFGPEDPVTREQLATILYRYAKYKGSDVSIGEETNILSYDDAIGGITEYAIPAMQWAVGSGIINGIDNKLEARGTATRAQAATMIQRLSEAVLK